MADVKIKRTHIAKGGVDFAMLFGAKFYLIDVSGHTPMLQEPQGVSTGGGKLARQHLLLKPKQTDSGSQRTVGWVNTVSKSCMIRSYECMVLMHEMRYKGRPFDLDQSAYQEFFDKAVGFFKSKQFQIEIETKPPDVDRGGARGGKVKKETSQAMYVWAVIATLTAVGLLSYVIFGQLIF
ncbi:hypothetical protein JYT22_00280 [Endomicrobium sp. AH-315-J14]|nr:hypothetical protein [Endomicrobium sp. AH-315-J14]